MVDSINKTAMDHLFVFPHALNKDPLYNVLDDHVLYFIIILKKHSPN